MTVCHHGQSASLLSALGLGHVLQYTPGALILSALHLNHSDAPSSARQNLHFAPFLLKKLLALSSVFALPTKSHHHCLIHRYEWLYCSILHSYSPTVKTWTFQTNQDRKAFVYPTNILVSRTGFVRCPRPCATASTAVCNVVHGRVQRCPRPRITNYRGSGNANVR